MKNNSLFVPLGIVNTGKSALLYGRRQEGDNNKGVIFTSPNGNTFTEASNEFVISNKQGKRINIADVSYLRLAKENKKYIGTIGIKGKNFVIDSQDTVNWKILGEMSNIKDEVVIVPDYTYKNSSVVYWKDTTFHIGFSSDFTSWNIYYDPIFNPEIFHNQSVLLLNCVTNNDEIFVIYAVRTKIEAETYYHLSVAIFSKEDPQKIIWRMPRPFWSLPEHMVNNDISPIGLAVCDEKICSYWVTRNNEILSIDHELLREIIMSQHKTPPLLVRKSPDNPIMSPRKENSWESLAVFNPAALQDEEKVHFLYRAVGDDWVSRFGYASSNDGVHIDQRGNLPAYVPREPFEGAFCTPDPNSPFTSGPGSGGCEDPRLTKIGNKIYLTYVAYNGMTGPRVALSSIYNEDFTNQHWKWNKPVLISKPGVIDKNATIFPEKIHGKYVVLHRIFPNILLDFVDSLDFDGNTFLQGEYRIAPKKFGWDSRKVGAGPPPIKTPYGWLLIYHAVDDKNDGKYQIGAMILDLNDPTKVLFRTDHPIIRPMDWYENEGYKSGVVYPCGAVVKDGLLHIYYGGADTYMCVASANMKEFLSDLTYKNTVTMNVTQMN